MKYSGNRLVLVDSSISIRSLVCMGSVVVLSVWALFFAGCDGDDTRRVTNIINTEPALTDGLNMDIASVNISDNPGVVVEFTLEDDDGNPVSLDSLDDDPSFVLAYIEVDPDSGLSRYQAYTVADVAGEEYVFDDMTEQPTLQSASQVVADSDGEFSELDVGSYQYTFGTELPADYDRDATHTLAAWVTREGRDFVSNSVFHFVPSGGPPTITRDITPTSACNDCHNPLSFHGGSRREVGLCVVCHTDQTVDPETGEVLEFKHLIHKLHHGEELTDLPYFIVGHQQGINDYSDLAYPQDDRYCTKCHRDADDASNWRFSPSRSACGSCHDDVNFDTGENHGGGIQQFDDTFCTGCHRGDQTAEFDNSVPGAHVVPYSSSANPNLTLAITDVQNMTPGVQPSVSFTINDDAGPVDIANLGSISMLFAGPTSDFRQDIGDNRFSVGGVGLTTNAVGDYTFAPDGYVIPIDATDTWSVGMEAQTNAIAVGGIGDTEDILFGANNPIVDIDLADGTLGGGAPEPRRAIIDEAACDTCHEDIVEHENLRTDIDYCVLCHNLWTTDEDQRPGVDPDTNPPESVDFKLMIHRIHRGVDLANPYVVFGLGGSANSYNKVRFPGDLRDCETCHLDGTHLLPVPDSAEATVVTVGGILVNQPEAIRTPTTTACTGCHDDDDAFTHARLNSIVDVNDPFNWSEACLVCHGEGSSVAVSESHAR